LVGFSSHPVQEFANRRKGVRESHRIEEKMQQPSAPNAVAISSLGANRFTDQRRISSGGAAESKSLGSAISDSVIPSV
jgi:hypothetical protein